jgi:hypothetical protein
MADVEGLASAFAGLYDPPNDTRSSNGPPTGKDPWLKTYWRPAMAWLYMLTCLCDFIIFPVLWSLLQAHFKGSLGTEWDPITLRGGGLFHVAMGAIIGVSAYGRTREKALSVTQASTQIQTGE